MLKFKRKQANSLWVTITCDNLVDIDPIWANWSGIWAVSDSVSGTEIINGTLEKDAVIAGKFILKLGPLLTTGWATLPVGTYSLYTQIDNATVDYRFEDTDSLIITAQGIA